MFKRLFGNKTVFKFKEPESTVSFVCNHVLDKERPILFASHDTDGNWQFLCGKEDHDESNIRLISLKNTTEIDPSVNDLWEMPEGYGAERNEVGGNWKPFKSEE
jgi:hypothetical protein